MRLNAGTLFLGFAAISNLPTVTGSALYGYIRENFNKSTNVTYDKRAVMAPGAKPVVNPVPHNTEPLLPGKDRNLHASGGDKAPNNGPVHLTPVEKKPENPNTGRTSIDRDMDLWCPSDMLSVLKRRSLRKRTGRPTCGRRSRSTRRTAEERRAFHEARGERAEMSFVRNREFDQEFSPMRVDNGYIMGRQRSPEDSVREFMPRTSYDEDHGFSRNPADWETWTTHARDNPHHPVSQISFGRSSRDDDGGHVAFVAHNMWAQHDSNRFRLDDNGMNLRDEYDDFIEQPGWEERAVSVAQLTHESARRNGAIRSRPRRLSLMSENVVGREAQDSIRDAFRDLGPDQNRLLLRRDSTGLEHTHYNRLSGVDNNYAYFNTMGRNPEYRDYFPEHLEAWSGPEFALSQTWRRKSPRRSPDRDW